MDGVLSQEEISALLNNPDDANKNDLLTDAEKDAIGEIGNISMGTAATTLFSLVNRKVDISTPVVSFATWSDICDAYEKPCVFIRIAYTVGLDGSNILVLREHDVKVITDLMMGGDGTNTDGELGELHLSAISEAMNQMMGSAATSLSSMLNRKIDISPPNATVINLQEDIDEAEIDSFLTGKFGKISFHMEIGDLVESTIMQLYPISFANDMWNAMDRVMTIFVFLMYCITSGRSITRALFYNCDHSLMKYGYYRRPDAILKNFRIRLRFMLKSELPMVVVLCVGFVIDTIIIGKADQWVKLLSIIACIVLLSIFYSVVYLCMYYIFQPYTEGGKETGVGYSVCKGVIYVASYSCLQIDTLPQYFAAIIMVITVVGLVAGYALAYLMAPKRFVLK